MSRHETITASITVHLCIRLVVSKICAQVALLRVPWILAIKAPVWRRKIQIRRAGMLPPLKVCLRQYDFWSTFG